MADQPTVCAVMLTADRPEYARRAVEVFRAQTYDPVKRMLLIFDSGSGSWYDPKSDAENEHQLDASAYRALTIGELRNMANACAGAEVFLHWDSDDYSHPNRVAEQVALLQASGADAVGYREMLFWKEPVHDPYREIGLTAELKGEAWLYSNPNPSYILGTSLCYWRRTWERKPFEPVSSGEDFLFTAGLKCAAASSLQGAPTYGNDFAPPRMIARIHAGNTSNAYDPAVMRVVEKQGGEWKRVPEWDAYCRSVMEK